MRLLIVQLAWSGPQRVALHRPDFPVFEVLGGQALEDCQLGLRLQGYPVVLSVWHFQ